MDFVMTVLSPRAEQKVATALRRRGYKPEIQEEPSVIYGPIRPILIGKIILWNVELHCTGPDPKFKDHWGKEQRLRNFFLKAPEARLVHSYYVINYD